MALHSASARTALAPPHAPTRVSSAKVKHRRGRQHSHAAGRSSTEVRKPRRASTQPGPGRRAEHQRPHPSGHQPRIRVHHPLPRGHPALLPHAADRRPEYGGSGALGSGSSRRSGCHVRCGRLPVDILDGGRRVLVDRVGDASTCARFTASRRCSHAARGETSDVPDQGTLLRGTCRLLVADGGCGRERVAAAHVRTRRTACW